MGGDGPAPEAVGGLRVDAGLKALVEEEVLPQLRMDPPAFWAGFEDIIARFTPRNRALLAERAALQAKIDRWHRSRAGRPPEAAACRRFLEEIGYLAAPAGDFEIATANVDREIAEVAAPQLVAPLKNARYALNAANARWGSLYDALYGTDAIPDAGGAARGTGYNPTRGAKVVAFVRRFLDRAVPLAGAGHGDVTRYLIQEGALAAVTGTGTAALRDPSQFAGYRGRLEEPSALLLRRHGLHVEIRIDRGSEVGRADPAGVSDVVLEAAVTVIQDCEDAVAAVDAADKVEVYRNWLGLIRGDLKAEFDKGGGPQVREPARDRRWLAPGGRRFALPGRGLLLIRNVGHLMRNGAVADAAGGPVYEGIMDAAVTGAIGALDAKGRCSRRNSRTGSVYIVKPKMHGPDEVRFTCDLFAAVEALLALPPSTLKLGIMDEERRTSLNLAACIRAARDRVAFINTGFLDRTGDEIRTGMEAGPMMPKAAMKDARWFAAYEDANVDAGLRCGLPGRAQIGKGMWAMPDRMAAMLERKSDHPLAGASTAWVPSPTAATLHAVHYHETDVAAVQERLRGRAPVDPDEMLRVPLAGTAPDAAAVRAELDNNVQGILGYVARWIDQGIGCSKVPDVRGVALMEDRATLRISSQHIANWLRHGVCGREQVMETFTRMAAVVDGQNEGDPRHEPMAPDPNASLAFRTACDLVFKGAAQPNGYTEPLLHAARLAKKRAGRA